MDLLDELQTRIVPADGALSTALRAAGIPHGRCLEELCAGQPELVQRIHEQSIAAGARLIETNSFGGNAVCLAGHGHEHRVGELNWSAAQLARSAAQGKDVHVAGCLGPLGITAEEAKVRGIDRQAVFMEQIGALLDGGARVVLLKTFSDLEELLIAIHVKHSLHHCPVIASITCNDDGRLPDGTSADAAFQRLLAADADIVGVDGLAAEAAVRLFQSHSGDTPRSAFLDVGEVTPTTPEDFARAVVQLANQGLRLIGGGRGAGPEHLAAMVEALRSSEEPG